MQEYPQGGIYLMNISFRKAQNQPCDISDQDFQRLSAFVHAQCGLEMPITKKEMLTTMIQERLQHVGRHSCQEYIDWVLGSDSLGGELVLFVDVATTREVYFFHGTEAFEFMVQIALPELIKKLGSGISRELMVWNAGCATGEEAYTLAMLLQEFAHHFPGINFKSTVLATDISSRALQTASDAIYSMEKIAPISMELKKKYFLKSKNPAEKLVRVVPELRAKVKFRRLNIMEEDFGLRERMDILFCRNVVTHFDRPTREKLVNKFCRYLAPGGYLFFGELENLNDLSLPAVRLAPTIYQMSQ